ncbi:MarR family winged helix-turn-helix transcriptional regulator [Latilactobacillus graminis]|uniref:Transcriptional regulator n=2 Tax=Latilactobacillus graminis TaxID=60519 RepID=A0AA89L0Q9_9LACO|nr:MarR family winged helix-turn-helix transcriptional regulator [Latilactobacillus graminis]KRM23634.1 transcriptional regulator [Latilactobacillus graminis DSM 20719]QFP80174.1 winged helix-turn-helix transcriptional regulator [Latilactobacillus graminis]
MSNHEFPPELEKIPSNIRTVVTLFGTLGQTIFHYINTESNKLTPLNSLIVFTVATNPGISMSNLAEELGAAKSQLSRNVTTLENLELVERRHNRENRRIVNVYPSESGLAFITEQFKKIGERLEDTLSVLSPTDRRKLDQSMAVSLTILAKADIVPSPPKHLDY